MASTPPTGTRQSFDFLCWQQICQLHCLFSLKSDSLLTTLHDTNRANGVPFKFTFSEQTYQGSYAPLHSARPSESNTEPHSHTRVHQGGGGAVGTSPIRVTQALIGPGTHGGGQSAWGTSKTCTTPHATPPPPLPIQQRGKERMISRLPLDNRVCALRHSTGGAHSMREVCSPTHVVVGHRTSHSKHPATRKRSASAGVRCSRGIPTPDC